MREPHRTGDRREQPAGRNEQQRECRCDRKRSSARSMGREPGSPGGDQNPAEDHHDVRPGERRHDAAIDDEIVRRGPADDRKSGVSGGGASRRARLVRARWRPWRPRSSTAAPATASRERAGQSAQRPTGPEKGDQHRTEKDDAERPEQPDPRSQSLPGARSSCPADQSRRPPAAVRRSRQEASSQSPRRSRVEARRRSGAPGGERQPQDQQPGGRQPTLALTRQERTPREPGIASPAVLDRGVPRLMGVAGVLHLRRNGHDPQPVAEPILPLRDAAVRGTCRPRRGAGDRVKRKPRGTSAR